MFTDLCYFIDVNIIMLGLDDKTHMDYEFSVIRQRSVYITLRVMAVYCVTQVTISNIILN